MINIDKVKIKSKLEKHFNRVAKENEIENAKNEPLILIEILFDEIEELKKKIK